MNNTLEKDTRNWVLAWALMQGLALLLLHKSIEAMTRPDQHFVWLWPLYAWFILLPVSLKLLAAHRQQRILGLLLAGFAAALAVMAGYDGWSAFVPGLPRDQ
jgi:hypothetical protein